MNSTEKDIIEGNRAINIFMEGNLETGGVKFFRGPDCFEHESGAHLKYHTSWDWLMPVVEKIDRLNYDTYISHTVQTIEGKGTTPFNVITCRIEDYWAKLEISETGETKIQAVYSAVLQFITWYNTTHLTEKE